MDVLVYCLAGLISFWVGELALHVWLDLCVCLQKKGDASAVGWQIL